jgi:hypothetical protein
VEAASEEVVAVERTQEAPASVQNQKVAAAEDNLDFALEQTMAGPEVHSLEPGRFVAGYSQLAPLVEDSLVP